jgi:ATP-dependent DNA helicase RecQ
MQEDIIRSVLNKNDTLALLPTGGGKSLCFQVPAMAMDGICIVISPLIALIKDQVQQLKKRGIPVLAVYAGMPYMEVKKTIQNAAFGNYKFLYLSPERLETDLFQEYIHALKPSMIAVDEAHCISQWGYDFRPSYLRIIAYREQFPDVPLIALTASATKKVQDDICLKLAFGAKANIFQQAFDRPNLSYSIFSPEAKETKLAEILSNVPGTAIVYCKSRRHTQQVAGLLNRKGIVADFYHAGLLSDDRSAKQDAWIKNQIRVMVCTNAFGMGIDKPDVRLVVHYDVPDCLENYYQEAGRAGRDGKRAYAVLLYQSSEIKDIENMIDIRYPSAEKIKNVYTALMNHLQVPAGYGEGISYDFDLAAFAAYFKINILEATYGIQALGQQGILSFNEIFFKPSSASFTISKNDLYAFEQQYPDLEPVIKALLRSYEGIFDYPTNIYEGLLAKFMRTDKDKVIAGLNKLNQYGVIEYNPMSEKPQIYLLKDRMYADTFQIDVNDLRLRKVELQSRVAALAGYMRNSGDCRSQLLANYFNASTNQRCRICDNCINLSQRELTSDELEKVYDQISRMLGVGPVAANELVKKLRPIKESIVWQAIHFLQGEDKIAYDEEGILQLKRK